MMKSNKAFSEEHLVCVVASITHELINVKRKLTIAHHYSTIKVCAVSIVFVINLSFLYTAQ